MKFTLRKSIKIAVLTVLCFTIVYMSVLVIKGTYNVGALMVICILIFAAVRIHKGYYLLEGNILYEKAKNDKTYNIENILSVKKKIEFNSSANALKNYGLIRVDVIETNEQKIKLSNLYVNEHGQTVADYLLSQNSKSVEQS